MQSAVETVSPTRVKLTVEVPFSELEPSMRDAYRRLAGQVRIPGFRPGKVPPRIIEQRLGRGAVLEEAVNDAIPKLYGQAVQDNEVRILGTPDIEVTELEDGQRLTFTAEVDVRPEVQLPPFDSLQASVEDADASAEEVEEQLASLRERFAVLQAADRPAGRGDHVSLDLAAVVDGQPLEDAAVTGLSYEVGSGSLVPGLDDVIVGVSEGESRDFDTELVAGEHAGRPARVTVTVRAVKAKHLPDLDDEFATTASEFDTLEELREDVRRRLERVKRLQQGVEARDRVLESLLERVELSLPEAFVEQEVQWRRRALDEQLEQYGVAREQYLAEQGQTSEQLEEEVRQSATQAVKSQLLLDAVADAEEIGVAQEELMDQIVRRAQRAGVAPDAYAQHLVEHNHLPELVGEVRRSKALALVMDAATINDASGRPVDLKALAAEAAPAGTAPVDGAKEARPDVPAAAEPAGTGAPS